MFFLAPNEGKVISAARGSSSAGTQTCRMDAGGHWRKRTAALVTAPQRLLHGAWGESPLQSAVAAALYRQLEHEEFIGVRRNSSVP